jgi:Phosphatidyl serine synthase
MNWIYDKPEGSHQAPCTNIVTNFVNKFRPNVWTRYDWSVFSSLTRYNQFIFFCCTCLGIDCMNFFMKYILWIPANHNILLIRLFIWAFACIASAKEFFEFISNKHCKRVGPYVWLSCLALGVEFSITFKFGRQMFIEPFPDYVKIMWGIIFSLLLMGGLYAYSNGCKNDTKKEKFDPQDPKIDVELV